MTFLELVLVIGVTARLVRLVQTDTIFDRPRARLQKAMGKRKIAELLWCPWCLSIWVGAAAAGSWWAWGERPWWVAAGAALTASHATGLLNLWEDR